jgi:hypothetical protein
VVEVNDVVLAEDKIFELVHAIAGEFELSDSELVAALSTVTHNLLIRLLCARESEDDGST